jgi:hypothetical protein
MSLSEKQIIELITNDRSADEYESSDFSDGSDSESNFTNSLRENLLISISNNTVVSENNRSLNIEILPIVCEDILNNMRYTYNMIIIFKLFIII